MDDQNIPNEPVENTTVPELAPAPVEPDSSQPTGSDTANMSPEAPESPINVPSNTPAEDQNQGVNQPESEGSGEPISAPNESEAPTDNNPASESIPVQSVPASAPAPVTPTAPQTQPSAQQNQTSFIRALLAKANAKLGSNRQKKLDKVMLLAQKKGFITNEQAQELLHCSDATATRYLSKLVQQGRLNRTDGSHWVKYIFVR
jgi:hypothetical protein